MKWLNKSCRWCFLVFSKIWGIFLDTFLCSWTQIQFSTASSSHFCCRRLRWGLRASLGNTSLIAVSLNDIQQRYLFFLNKIYLAPVQGSAFSLYSLNFPGVARFSWLPAFTALARAAEYLSAQRCLPFISCHFASGTGFCTVSPPHSAAYTGILRLLLRYNFCYHPLHSRYSL